MSLYVTGSNGISSLKPGNITGVPSLAGVASAANGAAITIQVGSGAEEPGGGPTVSISAGGATNNVVGLATVADPTARPAMTVIGGPLALSDSPVLPPGQSYHDIAPVGPAPSLNVVPQSTTAGPGGGGMFGPAYSPGQMGAPTLGPSRMSRGGMYNPIPGSLVPVTPMLPGNN
jgi:hypothetical protein